MSIVFVTVLKKYWWDLGMRFFWGVVGGLIKRQEMIIYYNSI